MQTPKTLTFLAATWLGLAGAVPGQPPGAPRDAAGPEAGNGSPASAPPRFGRPPLALMDALDADRDGKLSESEIQAAPELLKKLDKDGDGKLNAEEIGWPPRFPDGVPGGGPRGGPGGSRRGIFGGGPPGADRAQGNRGFVERLMNRDANRDGKITGDELPPSMRRLIPLGDRNCDGALDEKEATALAERFGMAADRADSKSPTHS